MGRRVIKQGDIIAFLPVKEASNRDLVDNNLYVVISKFTNKSDGDTWLRLCNVKTLSWLLVKLEYVRGKLSKDEFYIKVPEKY